MIPADLKNVDWLETTKLALARGFFSSIVLVLIALANAAPGQTPATAAILSFTVMWTLGGALFVFAMYLFLRIVSWVTSWFVPGGGFPWLFLLPYWLAIVAVALGDPIIWLIIKIAPGIFNVVNFRPFNFTPLLFVMRGVGQPALDLTLPRSWRRGGGFDQ